MIPPSHVVATPSALPRELSHPAPARPLGERIGGSTGGAVTPAASHYVLRLARNPDEIREAQALRYRVFNLELREGLAASHLTGLDADPFDPLCDHLLVEHLPSARIIGTYRLQTGTAAARPGHLGYYSAQEFNFAPFEPLRPRLVELGRACVEAPHRNLIVLGLLWKGIARYAHDHRARYLIGCSSLTSQNPAVGASAYNDLIRRHLAPHPWRTLPLPAYDCPLHTLAPEDEAPPLPKLLRAYLSLGAKICGPPALDRHFQTIDFLTLLDLDSLSPQVRQKFFGE
ncbi:Putative hemolysin [Verrucomicrobium sp. GAS474]|uniref:GNAT family N-acetyltransferase n=1 Tax=Verrucomicrobium sp. GAS474 TaxID=1882831 RepID=UPI000879FB22|nr:GNAT family N-acyltransferase [Verrucomicrobium sp. GAS474]SDT97644.1 Putative hemolysin [Verrucomicrobium sp. GAS474]